MLIAANVILLLHGLLIAAHNAPVIINTMEVAQAIHNAGVQ